MLNAEVKEGMMGEVGVLFLKPGSKVTTITPLSLKKLLGFKWRVFRYHHGKVGYANPTPGEYKEDKEIM